MKDFDKLIDECLEHYKKAFERLADDAPPHDAKKAWEVEEYNNKWYFYDSLGYPSCPFGSEELAHLALEDFSLYYEEE